MGMPFDEVQVRQHYKHMKEEFEAGGGGRAPAAGAVVKAEPATA